MAKIDKGSTVGRLNRQRPAQQCHAIARPVLLQAQNAQKLQGIGIGRIGSDELEISRFRSRHLALPMGLGGTRQ